MLSLRSPVLARFGLIALAYIILAPASYGQSIPDLEIIEQQNDQILRQQEQQRVYERQQLEKKRKQTIIQAPLLPSTEIPPSDSGPCFAYQSIDLRGKTFFLELYFFR